MRPRWRAHPRRSPAQLASLPTDSQRVLQARWGWELGELGGWMALLCQPLVGWGHAQGHPQVCALLSVGRGLDIWSSRLPALWAWGGAHSRGGHLGWVWVMLVFVLAGPAWERPSPAPASLEGRDLATQPQQVLSTWTGQTEPATPEAATWL